MKIRSLFYLLIFILSGSGYMQAQNFSVKEYNKQWKLSKEDKQKLRNLPYLTLPESYKGANAPLLPVAVDNSTQFCWRPVFAQVDYECGQAAGIGLAYTYEVNRLRNLPSDVSANQYPPHYLWNWGNGGNGYYGVSYFHSFEVVKACGTPTVDTYGGMYVGETEEERRRHWMNGYDNYYQAMKNRINETYQIDLSTPEGIQTLKYWIHDHLDGSDIGGVANFYANAPYDLKMLPAGTPEEYKYVVTSWGGANHGLTICAYHDSICWDYNGDGQYTNNIDINGDNVVDVRDWEIGGFRFANTYSGGPNFGNDGFCYMTYKSCADPSENGGIWNNAVQVLYAKEQMEPLLTAKITLSSNNRKSVRVRMGYAMDANASQPEFIMQFPIFNFQGGNFYFQGGTTEADKTIEFGLDITPFLNMIPSGTNAKYFLLVDENDPNGSYDGVVNNFSIIDYTNGAEEIACPQTDVPMVNDGTVMLSVTHTVNYQNDLDISTSVLDEGTLYQDYEFQVDADGGTPPYYYDFDKNYLLTTGTEDFPMVNAQDISPSNTNNGVAYQDLGFDFPFYGSSFSQVRVSVDGFIYFEDLLDWPYQVYDYFHFTKNKIIAPFMTDLFLSENAGDGMWYEGNDTTAIFRWKASIASESGMLSDLNFAVQLFASGRIFFYYGNNAFMPVDWISGVSGGDNVYYQLTEFNNDLSIPPNKVCKFTNQSIPSFLQISPAGMISGMPTQNYDNFPLRVRVRDANNFYATKSLTFSTDGAVYLNIEDFTALNQNSEPFIGYGDTIRLSMTMKNLGNYNVSGVEMQIHSDDPYIELLDSTEYLGDFGPLGEITFNNIFTFVVANDVPNNYPFTIGTTVIDSQSNEWEDQLEFSAFAPVLVSTGISVLDGGNGSLDPGETTDIAVEIKNIGFAAAENIQVLCSSSDPFITVNQEEASISSLGANEYETITFNVSVADDALQGYVSTFNFMISADQGYENSTFAGLVIGVSYEGFESGDLSFLPWETYGDTSWFVVEEGAYEGNYVAKSGDMVDNEQSSLQLHASFITDGEVSFAHKVSSELNYDYLKFYIDGSLQESWSGELGWEVSEYPLDAGVHILKWVYTKDYSVSQGEDCAWIDFINLPPIGDVNPQLTIYPGSIQDSLLPDIIHYDTIMIQNTGDYALFYTVSFVDNDGNEVEWLQMEQNTGGLNAGESRELPFAVFTNGMESGNYEAIIRVTDHTQQNHDIPYFLNVDLANRIINSTINPTTVFPNPFADQIRIGFDISKASNVSYSIYDTSGKLLKKEELGSLFPGAHQIVWDGKDDRGRVLPPAVYYLYLKAGNVVNTQRIVKIR